MAGLLIRNAQQVATFASAGQPKRGEALADPGALTNTSVAIKGDRVVAVGSEADVCRALEEAPERVIDADGLVVLPGLVDPHTHPLFVGKRALEFELRLTRGQSFLAFVGSEHGVYGTVRATQAASDDALTALVEHRLRRMLAQGTTTVEAKSGYGLSVEEELRHLRVIRAAAARVPVRVVPTALCLHFRPPANQNDPEPWVEAVISELMPAVVREGLASAIDVYCEPDVFSEAQCRRVLAAARRLGLLGRVHADQLRGSGGAELAAEFRCLSADHLGYVSAAGIAALATSGTPAVLIPGSVLFVPGEQCPPVRDLVDAGVIVALATDFTPGSSPLSSQLLVVGLACALFQLSAAEALAAATINAAYAVGLAAEVGSIEPGKRADLILLEADDYREVPYRFGENLVRTVISDGHVVAERPPVGPL